MFRDPDFTQNMMRGHRERPADASLPAMTDMVLQLLLVFILAASVSSGNARISGKIDRTSLIGSRLPSAAKQVTLFVDWNGSRSKPEYVLHVATSPSLQPIDDLPEIVWYSQDDLRSQVLVQCSRIEAILGSEEGNGLSVEPVLRCPESLPFRFYLEEAARLQDISPELSWKASVLTSAQAETDGE